MKTSPKARNKFQRKTILLDIEVYEDQLEAFRQGYWAISELLHYEKPIPAITLKQFLNSITSKIVNQGKNKSFQSTEAHAEANRLSNETWDYFKDQKDYPFYVKKEKANMPEINYEEGSSELAQNEPVFTLPLELRALFDHQIIHQEYTLELLIAKIFEDIYIKSQGNPLKGGKNECIKLIHQLVTKYLNDSGHAYSSYQKNVLTGFIGNKMGIALISGPKRKVEHRKYFLAVRDIMKPRPSSKKKAKQKN
jgi:hypothetical protein